MSEPEGTALVVDDDEDLRNLIAMSLEDMGYKAHVAIDVPSARKWLEGHQPTLIILDIMMPGGNGLDLCRWIRAQERLAKVPILVSSALKDEETAQDALELGAVDFLQKPFAVKTLREKIERMRRR